MRHRITHDARMGVWQVFLTNDYLAIAMEYASGGDLFTLVGATCNAPLPIRIPCHSPTVLIKTQLPTARYSRPSIRQDTTLCCVGRSSQRAYGVGCTMVLSTNGHQYRLLSQNGKLDFHLSMPDRPLLIILPCLSKYIPIVRLVVWG